MTLISANGAQSCMQAWIKPLKELRGEDGQSMVETALSLILAFSMAFLVFEASMLAYTYSVLNNAAREGVRYAIVHGTDSSSCSGPSTGCGDSTAANVKAVVNAYAATSFHDISGMQVTVSYPDATQSKPMSLVVVNVTYKFGPYFNLFSVNSTLNLSSEGRILF
jgi:Flp pilus assembly protein TadG